MWRTVVKVILEPQESMPPKAVYQIASSYNSMTIFRTTWRPWNNKKAHNNMLNFTKPQQLDVASHCDGS